MSHPLSDPIALAPTWENVEATLRTPAFQTEALPAYVRQCRWFGGKARALRRVGLADFLPLGRATTGRDAGGLSLLRARYMAGEDEIYLLPLQIGSSHPGLLPAIAHFVSPEGNAVLFDAVEDESFRAALFELMLGERRVATADGELVGVCGAPLRDVSDRIALPLTSRALKAEQSNSSLIYDGRYFLKLYRKPELGENPDAELLRFLSVCQHFPHVPAFCGAIELRTGRGATRVLGLLVANVANDGDGWTFTLRELEGFYDRLQAGRPNAASASPALVERMLGSYPQRARQLGERTAQMHLALAADTEDPNFAPEPFTDADQRSLAAAMIAETRKMQQLLRREIERVPAPYRHEAAALLERTDDIVRRQQRLLDHPVTATRIRHHGDYHLGQVLNTGADFIIIDFEGEPARPLSERRTKRSPLRDVAGMLRSFHYAAHSGLGQVAGADPTLLAPWAELWAQHIGDAFLDAYLTTANGASFLPTDEPTLATMIEVHLLEKAAYEVRYELNNRPDWAYIPIRGIARILDAPPRLSSNP